MAAGLETGVAVDTVPAKVLLLLLMGSGTVGSAWLACVAMWPWSWVGVLQWTPHSWHNSTPPGPEPRPMLLSFHSCPWCF